MKRNPNPRTLREAIRELFDLSARIQSAQKCHEVAAFTEAGKRRPDLYHVVCSADPQELDSALDQLEQERTAGRIQAAA